MISRPKAHKWTPRRFPNLRTWLDADNLSSITKDGSNFVSSWKSIVNPTQDFVQAVASKQPLWVGAAWGTKLKPYIQFDGIDDILQTFVTPMAADTQGFMLIVGNVGLANYSAHLFSVANSLGSNYQTIASFNQSGNRVTVFNSDGTTLNRVQSTTGLIQHNVIELKYIESTGVLYNIHQNQNQLTDTATSGVDNGDWYGDLTGLNNSTVGGRHVNSNFLYTNCKISEVIICGDLPTTNQLGYLKKYLNQKYGIY